MLSGCEHKYINTCMRTSHTHTCVHMHICIHICMTHTCRHHYGTYINACVYFTIIHYLVCCEVSKYGVPRRGKDWEILSHGTGSAFVIFGDVLQGWHIYLPQNGNSIPRSTWKFDGLCTLYDWCSSSLSWHGKQRKSSSGSQNPTSAVLNAAVACEYGSRIPKTPSRLAQR